MNDTLVQQKATPTAEKLRLRCVYLICCCLRFSEVVWAFLGWDGKGQGQGKRVEDIPGLLCCDLWAFLFRIELNLGFLGWFLITGRGFLIMWHDGSVDEKSKSKSN